MNDRGHKTMPVTEITLNDRGHKTMPVTEITFADLERKVEEVRVRADQLLSLGVSMFRGVTGASEEPRRERGGIDSEGFLPRAMGMLRIADADLEELRELLNRLHNSLDDVKGQPVRARGA